MSGKWKPPPPDRPNCDHVYHMVYTSERVWCDACGLTWTMGEWGWKTLRLAVASHGEINGSDFF